MGGSSSLHGRLGECVFGSGIARGKSHSVKFSQFYNPGQKVNCFVRKLHCPYFCSCIAASSVLSFFISFPNFLHINIYHHYL